MTERGLATPIAGLARSRRPANVVIAVEDPLCPIALKTALNTIKKRLADAGVSRLLKRRGSRLFEYHSPSQRRRVKAAIARARMRKIAAFRARLDSRP